MKISVQEKIAELERRIAALELRHTHTTTTIRCTAVDLEPEMSSLWKTYDALIAKVFKR